MGFQTHAFIFFWGVTVVLFRASCRFSPKSGIYLLTLFSLGFYLSVGGVQSLTILLLGVCVSWSALYPAKRRETFRRSAILLACGYHIFILAAVKYFPGVSMPPGISFFTFQQLWILKEAYTGTYRKKPEDSLLLHAFFFPTVLSGPILRPAPFFTQLDKIRCQADFNQNTLWPDLAAGLYALSLGYAKKTLLADNLGIIVNNGWEKLLSNTLSFAESWLIILGYALQLYLDFSGYCDIATGCARMLGIHLPVNFDAPYLSRSISEFWKRWHKTLTDFLRECIYFPLGGSRRGRVRSYFLILLVFLISGLWHGNGWTFMIWGLLHGFAQVFERILTKPRQHLPDFYQWLGTFLFVCIAWVFFHAPNLTAAGAMLRSAVSIPFFFDTSGALLPDIQLFDGFFTSEQNAVHILFPSLAGYFPGLMTIILYSISFFVAFQRKTVIQRMENFPLTGISAGIIAIILAISILSFSGVTTFIYTNF